MQLLFAHLCVHLEEGGTRGASSLGNRPAAGDREGGVLVWDAIAQRNLLALLVYFARGSRLLVRDLQEDESE